MEYEEIAARVGDIPYMSRKQGRKIYDHVRARRPAEVLEIGTANAVGASYMAAALEAKAARARSRASTARRELKPGPAKVLADAGLNHRVDLIRNPDSSYNWWLKKQIAARTDAAGNAEPVYDLVYLDGAHTWDIDGLAAILVEKLLKPEGWLVLDDMDWTHATSPTLAAAPPPEFSDEQLREPHMQAVFDVLLKSHPSFTEFRDDGDWGCATKAPGAPRGLTLQTQTAARQRIMRDIRVRLGPLLRRQGLRHP